MTETQRLMGLVNNHTEPRGKFDGHIVNSLADMLGWGDCPANWIVINTRSDYYSIHWPLRHQEGQYQHTGGVINDNWGGGLLFKEDLYGEK